MSVFGSDNNNRRPGEKERSRTQHINSNRSSASYDGREGSGLGARQRNQLIGAIILIVLAGILTFFLFGSNDKHSENTEPATPVVSPNGGQNTQSMTIETAPSGQTPQQPLTEQSSTQPADQNVQPGAAQPGSAMTEESTQPVPDRAGQGSVAQSTNPDYTPNFGDTETSHGQNEKSTADEQNQSVAQSTSQKPSKPAEPAKPKAKPAETAKAKPQANSKPATPPKSSNRIAEKDRTDDGSRAAALLAGKTPDKASSPQSGSTVTAGNFSIQLMSLSTADAARIKRDELNSKGVNNAFVQIAQVNGRNTYRVKVGPFKSRESAQANVTRFRQMGYSGAMVTGN